jgi:predicted  nucleic acid-binding Zn-ribbon protein
VVEAESEATMLQSRCDDLTEALDSLDDTQEQATKVLNTAEQQLAMMERKCHGLEQAVEVAMKKRCAIHELRGNRTLIRAASCCGSPFPVVCVAK